MPREREFFDEDDLREAFALGEVITLSQFEHIAPRLRHAAADVAVAISFQNDEATRRLVMHSARRVIKDHNDELHELAYR